MLKCSVDKKKGRIWVKAGGELGDLTTELLALFKEIHAGIAKKNPEAAEQFKNTVIGAILDPKSPLWEE